jgi:hypothetical protein
VAFLDHRRLRFVGESQDGNARAGPRELGDQAGQPVDLVVVDAVGRLGDVGARADLAGE